MAQAKEARQHQPILRRRKEHHLPYDIVFHIEIAPKIQVRLLIMEILHQWPQIHFKFHFHPLP